MKILSYNPGHDGAVAYLRDGRLVFSIEAEEHQKKPQKQQFLSDYTHLLRPHDTSAITKSDDVERFGSRLPPR